MVRAAVLVVALAALGAVWYSALPPRTQVLPETAVLTRPPRGVVHVHTNRSDGTGSVEDVAAAAMRAGLDFVVLTDHGDGTRTPDAPRYVEGVLCIDAVEISTAGGHLVAVGMAPAPYPLGGEARDVLEDVHRLGGFAIAAHPGSEKPELRWEDWRLPIDGLEWLNGDSEWRDESAWSLLRALFTYPARGTATIVSLLDRPDEVLRQWDALTQERRVVGLAGADAHARVGIRSLGEPYANGPSLPIPSYEQVFRALSISLPGVQLTGDPAADGRAVEEAIREGRVYSSVDGLAGPAALSFTAAGDTTQVTMGQRLPETERIGLRVAVEAPAGARIELWKDGALLAHETGTNLEHGGAGDGVYRVEVRLTGAPGSPPVPWILSNPIYVGRAAAAERDAARPRPATEFSLQYDDGPAEGWAVERSPASAAALDVVPAVDGTQLSFRYALGGTASASPYAALVMPAGEEIEQYERLVFTARAVRPMRLSVQLRAPQGEAGERWHRSVVLGPEPRRIEIAFDDLRPRGATSTPGPVLSEVDSILFVVDTVNTELGGNGQIWIDDVRYAR